MKCTHVRSLFSARLDGELSAQGLQEFEEHRAGCTDCSLEWQEFESSLQALRGVGVGQVSDHYVDAIVAAAVEANGDALPVLVPRARLSLVSHAAALLLGAAVMLLLFWLQGFNNGEVVSPVGAPTLVQATDRWSFEQGSGTLQRADRDQAQIAGTVALQDGDHLLVEPGSTLQFLGAGGHTIEIEVAQAPAPEVRIEMVETIVERIEYVTLPTPPPLRSLELEQALTFAGTAFARMCDALQTHADLLELGPGVSEILANAEATPVLEEQRTRPAPRHHTRRASVPNYTFEETVVVHRDGATLSLETCGSLDEVVPALIAQIDNEDPRVGALAQNRLREIWSARTGADWNDAPFGVDQGSDAPRTGWQRWGSSQQAPKPDLDPAREWSAWWASQQTTLARAGN